MARTKARARRNVARDVSGANAKTPEGRKADQELMNKKRNRVSFDEKESVNVDGKEIPDARPSKKAKTDGDQNSSRTDHVSQTNSSNTTTSTGKQPGTQSSIRPKSKNDTISEFAPPLYGDIANTHDITHISVLTSTKIQTKVTIILEKLAQYPAISPAKPPVIFIHSRAAAASKMITIVEVAKRDIASRGGKWFQYNTINRVMKEIPRDEAKGIAENKDANKAGENEEEEEQDEEGSFEVMKTPFERAIEGTPKVRNFAILGTYLSRSRIEGGLIKKYGEQTNALEVKTTHSL